MNIVWFNQHATPQAVGGKGYRMSLMAQAGLPVPDGFCIPADFIETITVADIDCACSKFSAKSLAVRSSACDEDGAQHSFAGIYKTVLNVTGGQNVWNAVQEVRDSACGTAAQAYRRRLGIATEPKMAAVVQTMLPADAAGVLFTQDPIERSDRMVIEGAWGLGESVVAGMVTPDRWILTQDGKAISRHISHKETATVPGTTGTEQIEVPENRRRVPCLTNSNLEEIIELARRCQQLFESPQEIEWAIAFERVWLLQSRPITGSDLV